MIEPLRIVFDVACEPDHAFRVWTQRASMWWPPSHTAANRRGTRLVFEPGPGGRVFERDPDGNEIDWGSVLVWEPPGRLVYQWHLFGGASEATEVEVHFVANGDGTTRVELEHRGWDAFDDGYALTLPGRSLCSEMDSDPKTALMPGGSTDRRCMGRLGLKH